MIYNVSGLSRQGESGIKNSDNIYINGVYMDSFTFSRYEKNICINDNIALYVLCAGHGDGDVSKQLLKKIREEQQGDTPRLAKELLSAAVQAVAFCDIQLSATPGRALDVAVLVTEGENCYAVTFGRISIMVKEQNTTFNLCYGDERCAVGTGNVISGTADPICRRLLPGSRILMYTDETAAAFTMRDFDMCMNADSAASCVAGLDRVLEQRRMELPASMICIDMPDAPKVEEKGTPVGAVVGNTDDGSMKKVIIGIAIVFAVIVIGMCIFLFGSGGGGKNSHTVERINAEHRDKKNLEERVELLVKDLDTIDGYSKNIDGFETDRDAKALDVDVKLLKAGCAEWEYLANSDEARNLNTAISAYEDALLSRDDIIKSITTGDTASRIKAVGDAETYVTNMGTLYTEAEKKHGLYVEAYNARIKKAEDAAKASAQAQKPQATKAPGAAAATKRPKQQQPQQQTQQQPKPQQQTQQQPKPQQSAPQQQTQPKPQTQQKPAAKPNSGGSGGSFGSSNANGSQM